MNNQKYYINKFTGSVDTLDNWIYETDDIECLVEVIEAKENEGVKCQNGKYWIEA